MSSEHHRTPGSRSASIGGIVRSLVLPCLGTLVSIGAIYGALALPGALGAGDASLYAASGLGAPSAAVRPRLASPMRLTPGDTECRDGCSLAVARYDAPPVEGRDRVLLAALEPSSERFATLDASTAAAQAKLAAAIRRAALKPAASGKAARAGKKALPASVLHRMEAKGPKPDSAPIVLAYAAAERSRAARALDVFSALPPQDPFADDDDDDTVMIVPDFEATPETTPLPLRRPRLENIERPDRPAKQVERKDDADEAPAARKPQRQDAAPLRRGRPADQEAPAGTSSPRAKLAYARPDEPSAKGKGSWSTPRFFGSPKAGNGVAVYDVSAAKVYMPDGSVLEAHSGIGKMADNPRYEKVKMGGPTPAHTYNLRMREKRFHGVEAIRMLPVDGRNKHGRDGFLTHSYLLRGGRAESHGCVAFKDYNKFLNAYKQGKVKQLVVVPSGGRGTVVRMAAAGRGA
jgi:hypothetical protein